jgi:hypothetical protein
MSYIEQTFATGLSSGNTFLPYAISKYFCSVHYQAPCMYWFSILTPRRSISTGNIIWVLKTPPPPPPVTKMNTILYPTKASNIILTYDICPSLSICLGTVSLPTSKTVQLVFPIHIERIEVVQKSAVPRVSTVSFSKFVWKWEKHIWWTFCDYMTVELIQDEEYDKFC